MDDFTAALVGTAETTIFVRRGGSGPAVLLLHGFPQTHLMWRDVAPRLAPRFTVVCADLRGHGRSGCPVSTPDHAPYAKRSEEHTSELQSQSNLVCRLLLEKKKKKIKPIHTKNKKKKNQKIQ